MEKITITQGVPFCTIQTSCRNYPKKKFCSISLQNFWNVLINISHNKSARTIPLGRDPEVTPDPMVPHMWS